MQKYWNMLKNRQMYRKTDIHTYMYSDVQKTDIQTDRQTDRTDRNK